MGVERSYARTPPERLLVISGLSACLGLAGGLVGYVFLKGTALLLNLVLVHRASGAFPDLATVRPGWSFVPAVVTGGALGSLLGQALRVSPAERKILLARAPPPERLRSSERRSARCCWPS